MNLILSLVLTLLLPIIPWISLSAWWVMKNLTVTWLWTLFVAGLTLDFWWGRTLGATSLVLLGLTGLLYFGQKAWPASSRSFTPLALIASLIIFEVYLLL